MRRRSTATAAAAVLVALAIVISTATAGGRTSGTPKDFFGIVPQTVLTDRDVQYMSAGHVGAIRVPVQWYSVQPTSKGGYDWAGLDQAVEIAARANLTVLPFLYGTPNWLAGDPTKMPIDSAKARNAWAAFVRAAVKRYGPGGEFWTEHAPGGAPGGIGVSDAPTIAKPQPIRTWQIWNEANFFYFAYPVSPSRYARLLKLTHAAIKGVDPGAKVVLSGLFGDPDEHGRRGMAAADFLKALYRTPGIKADFDAVALHPYAFHVDVLEELVEDIRAVVLENHDPGAGLYITEMGWGSQNDPGRVAFEQGIQGQARELRGAYRYLIDNRRSLNLQGTYWYSWKDVPGTPCNFCDSVGLFRAGKGFRPKPAWHAFVALSGGRARP
jgi:hypothetical protein